MRKPILTVTNSALIMNLVASGAKLDGRDLRWGHLWRAVKILATRFDVDKISGLRGAEIRCIIVRPPPIGDIRRRVWIRQACTAVMERAPIRGARHDEPRRGMKPGQSAHAPALFTRSMRLGDQKVLGLVDQRRHRGRTAVVGMVLLDQRAIGIVDLLVARPAREAQRLIGALARHRPAVVLPGHALPVAEAFGAARERAGEAVAHVALQEHRRVVVAGLAAELLQTQAVRARQILEPAAGERPGEHDAAHRATVGVVKRLHNARGPRPAVRTFR